MTQFKFSNKIKYIAARIIKKLSYKIGQFIYFFTPNFIIYGMQNKLRPVKYKNRKIFLIEDKSWITRYRAISFEYKEPETLKWIESFDQNQCLLDVGANIGMYTLFALFKGKQSRYRDPITNKSLRARFWSHPEWTEQQKTQAPKKSNFEPRALI